MGVVRDEIGLGTSVEFVRKCAWSDALGYDEKHKGTQPGFRTREESKRDNKFWHGKAERVCCIQYMQGTGDYGGASRVWFQRCSVLN